MEKIIKNNNGKGSKSNIILIETLDECNKYLKKIEDWFLKCLDELVEKNKISVSNSKFVVNILNKDFFGNINKKDKIIILFQNGDNPGPLLESIFDEDNIILVDEYNNDNYISSKELLNILRDEPEFINKIGVSSVSKKCMEQFWDDMTCKSPLTFKTPINNTMYIYENMKWEKKTVTDSYGINSFNFK